MDLFADTPRRPAPGRALVALLLFLAASPALAQQFGRWWWDGRLAAGQRDNENRLDGRSAGSWGERNLGLSLGLNGYLGHPALGSFRLGLEGLRTDLKGLGSHDTSRVGGSLDLSVLPRSSFPFRLALRHNAFTYSNNSDGGAALPLAAAARTNDSLSARLRLRTGWLKGTYLGYEATQLEFEDPALKSDRDTRGFADWDRRFGAFDNRLRLERRHHDFGLFDYTTDVDTATFDQLARLAGVWDWRLSVSALSTTLDFDSVPSTTLDDRRFAWQVAREIRSRDLADLRLEASDIASGGSSSRGWGATFSYRLRPRPGFELAPYVQDSELSGDDVSGSTRGAGVAFSWNRAGGVETALNASVGGATTRFDGAAGSSSQDRWTWTLGGSLRRGDIARLRAEIDAEAGGNQLRLARSDVAPVPDSQLLGVGLGEEDYARTRFRLEHRYDGHGLSGYVEWSLRRVTPFGSESAIDQQTSSLTLQGHWGTLAATANAGHVEVSGQATANQSIDFAAFATTWRVLRYLDLRASWRADRRDLIALPDLETSRAEAGAVFHAGLLDLRADYYLATDRVAGGSERRHAGWSWAITRDFAGWLPIVTGARRRGEIH